MLYRQYYKHTKWKRKQIKIETVIVLFLIKYLEKVSHYLRNKYVIPDYGSLNYFTSQSEIYPYWWRNYSWWGYRNMEYNPIYTHHQRKDYIKNMSYCNKKSVLEYCPNIDCKLCKIGKVRHTTNSMPRAGKCNGCTLLLAGSVHCEGLEMGCDCECIIKYL